MTDELKDVNAVSRCGKRLVRLLWLLSPTARALAFTHLLEVYGISIRWPGDPEPDKPQ